jgi:hypothetical protein
MLAAVPDCIAARRLVYGSGALTGRAWQNSISKWGKVKVMQAERCAGSGLKTTLRICVNIRDMSV